MTRQTSIVAPVGEREATGGWTRENARSGKKGGFRHGGARASSKFLETTTTLLAPFSAHFPPLSNAPSKKRELPCAETRIMASKEKESDAWKELKRRNERTDGKEEKRERRGKKMIFFQGKIKTCHSLSLAPSESRKKGRTFVGLFSLSHSLSLLASPTCPPRPLSACRGTRWSPGRGRRGPEEARAAEKEEGLLRRRRRRGHQTTSKTMLLPLLLLVLTWDYRCPMQSRPPPSAPSR